MDGAEAKRRKIQYLKGEETANPALIAAGPDQGSLALIPPSPSPEELEDPRDKEAVAREKPGDEEPESN